MEFFKNCCFYPETYFTATFVNKTFAIINIWYIEYHESSKWVFCKNIIKINEKYLCRIVFLEGIT